VLPAPLVAVATTATMVYLGAAVLFYLLHRRRPAAVLLSLVTAFALLAETMVAVSLAPRWHLSWWEWHLLLSAGFGFVAYSAYVQYRREGSAAGIFDAVTLAETARRIRAEYGAALEEYVTALQRGDVGGGGAARLADRFGLTEGQTAVLERAGAALAVERDLGRRLGALVAVGERARIGLGETEFLAAAVELLGRGFGEVHIGLMSDGVARVGDRAYPDGVLRAGPVRAGSFRGYPLMVKGRVAGVLEVGAHSAAAAGPELLRTVVDQVSIALENARLYRELGTLFRSYLSPDVAAALLADPGQARLGGSLVEVTALFADLRGFTAFSEDVEPAQIVTMLNRYHGVAVPCVLDNGGTIVQFVGDALLALFNAPARQSDHPVRAVRAALQLQAAVEVIAAGQPGWPRFRVGTNTGPALVGNIGSESLRGFNAMGDAVNVAARLQGLAEPGQVVAGHATVTRLGPGADVRELGELTVKGRRQTVRAYVVAGL
jgi:class 3 adenylate cyclase